METFGIATVAFIIAGFIKGVVGFGFPIIALIILTLSIGLLDALAIVVIPTLVTNLWQAFSGEYLQAILVRMWRYFLVAVVSIWITSDYLKVVDIDWLTMLLGTVLFFFALSRLFNFHITVSPRYEHVLAVPLGAVNGILTGLTGSFMVPSVLYMQASRFPRRHAGTSHGCLFFHLRFHACNVPGKERSDFRRAGTAVLVGPGSINHRVADWPLDATANR